jgi:nitrite reductase (NADH) small subunit
MSELIDIGLLGDFTSGVPVRVETPVGPVLVVRVDDDVFAVSDACPHRGTSLATGLFRGTTITCPAHLWRFDVRDGSQCGHPPGGPRSPGDAMSGLSTVIVSIDESDRVIVEIPLVEQVAPLSWRERLLAAAKDSS